MPRGSRPCGHGRDAVAPRTRRTALASTQKGRAATGCAELHRLKTIEPEVRIGIVSTTSDQVEAAGTGFVKSIESFGRLATLGCSRLSFRNFKDKQARLQLFALAYNLGNFLRRFLLPMKVRHWSLRSLLVKLIKTGAKVARHARYVVFQMAEVAVPRQLFAAILGRIRQWAAKARAAPPEAVT